MKTIFVAALVTAAVAATTAHADLQLAATLLARQALANSLKMPSMERSFGAQLNADCTDCYQDPTFLLAAYPLRDQCGAAFAALSVGINTTLDANIDAAWSTFCTSSCFTSIGNIAPQYYCCLEGAGPSFFHLKNYACKMSTEAPTRRCGAEMSNVAKISCPGQSASDCAASGISCEWQPLLNMCVFKPTEAALAYVCTKCNREFIEAFPTGGLSEGAAFTGFAAAYQTMCLSVDGTRCLAKYADAGFVTAATATEAQLTGLCSNATTKRCVRALGTVMSESLRRKARSDYQMCNASVAMDTACGNGFVATVAAANALEEVTATMCATNNGTGLCYPRVRAVLAGDSALCLQDTFMHQRCNASCEQPIAAAATAMGCCGPVVGRAGLFALQQITTPTQLMLYAGALNLNTNVNYTAAVPAGQRPPMSDAMAELLETQAVTGREATNAFGGLGRCTGFSGYSAWITTTADCARVRTRTYRFALRLRYDKLTQSPLARELKKLLIYDLALALGVTPRNLRSVEFTANTSLTLRLLGTLYSATTMQVTVAGDTDADNAAMDATIAGLAARKGVAFPSFGAFARNNCPDCMETGYTPVMEASAVVYSAGDTAPPQTGSAAPATSGAQHASAVGAAVLATVLIALVALA